jgi:hypothetical protein
MWEEELPSSPLATASLASAAAAASLTTASAFSGHLTPSFELDLSDLIPTGTPLKHLREPLQER